MITYREDYACYETTDWIEQGQEVEVHGGTFPIYTAPMDTVRGDGQVVRVWGARVSDVCIVPIHQLINRRLN